MVSLLPIVDVCDNFRVMGHCTYISFVLDSAVLGLLLEPVVNALRADNELRRKERKPEVWDTTFADAPSDPFVTFHSWLDTPEKRSQAVKELTERWRDTGMFPRQVAPSLWRDEHYPVYYRPFGPLVRSNLAFTMERAACPLFGVVIYSVHMTMYTPDYKVWVPTRARNKPTWPGYLDNTVAGGIPTGLTPREAMIKECMEEASLCESLVEANLKLCGTITYFYQKSDGWLQPGVQFVYELCLPSNSSTCPIPSDGEVEGFELCSLDDVLSKMHRKLFKPNCAMVLVDFLIRHGHITPESEENYMEIVSRIHGNLDFAKRAQQPSPAPSLVSSDPLFHPTVQFKLVLKWLWAILPRKTLHHSSLAPRRRA